MRRMIITRFTSMSTQTQGFGILVDENNNILVNFVTLELPWKNNQQLVSCVPAGKYNIVHRSSLKFKKHFHVLDVNNRHMILIHSGNFNYNTHGCILVGSTFVDMNKDGLLDIANSRATLDTLLRWMPRGGELIIIDNVE